MGLTTVSVASPAPVRLADGDLTSELVLSGGSRSLLVADLALRDLQEQILAELREMNGRLSAEAT